MLFPTCAIKGKEKIEVMLDSTVFLQMVWLWEKAAKALFVYIVDLDSKTQSASSDAPNFPCNAVSANPYPPLSHLLPWPRGGSWWVRGRPSLRSATRLTRLAAVHVDLWAKAGAMWIEGSSVYSHNDLQQFRSYTQNLSGAHHLTRLVWNQACHVLYFFCKIISGGARVCLDNHNITKRISSKISS